MVFVIHWHESAMDLCVSLQCVAYSLRLYLNKTTPFYFSFDLTYNLRNYISDFFFQKSDSFWKIVKKIHLSFCVQSDIFQRFWYMFEKSSNKWRNYWWFKNLFWISIVSKLIVYISTNSLNVHKHPHNEKEISTLGSLSSFD